MKKFKIAIVLGAAALFFAISCSKPEKEALFFNIANYYQALPERKARYNLIKGQIKKHNIKPLEFKQTSLAKTYGNIGKILTIKPETLIFSEPFLASYLTANPEKIEFNNHKLVTYGLPEKTPAQLPVFNIQYDTNLLFDKVADFIKTYFENKEPVPFNYVQAGQEMPDWVIPFPDDYTLKNWDLGSWHVNPRVLAFKTEKKRQENKCLILIHNSYKYAKNLAAYSREHEYGWNIFSNTNLNPDSFTQTLQASKPELIILFSFENNRVILEVGEELLENTVILEFNTIYSSLLKNQSYIIREDFDLMLTEGLASDEFRKFIFENSVKKENFINHTVDNKDIITIREAQSKKVLFK